MNAPTCSSFKSPIWRILRLLFGCLHLHLGFRVRPVAVAGYFRLCAVAIFAIFVIVCILPKRSEVGMWIHVGVCSNYIDLGQDFQKAKMEMANFLLSTEAVTLSTIMLLFLCDIFCYSVCGLNCLIFKFVIQVLSTIVCLII